MTGVALLKQKLDYLPCRRFNGVREQPAGIKRTILVEIDSKRAGIVIGYRVRQQALF